MTVNRREFSLFLSVAAAAGIGVVSATGAPGAEPATAAVNPYRRPLILVEPKGCQRWPQHLRAFTPIRPTMVWRPTIGIKRDQVLHSMSAGLHRRLIIDANAVRRIGWGHRPGLSAAQPVAISVPSRSGDTASNAKRPSGRGLAARSPPSRHRSPSSLTASQSAAAIQPLANGSRKRCRLP